MVQGVPPRHEPLRAVEGHLRAVDEGPQQAVQGPVHQSKVPLPCKNRERGKEIYNQDKLLYESITSPFFQSNTRNTHSQFSKHISYLFS